MRTSARSASACPASLPVPNEEALKMTALTGEMLGCQIAAAASSTGRIISTRTCRRTTRSRSTTSRSAWAARCRCRPGLPEGRAEEHRARRQAGPARAHPPRGGRGEVVPLRDHHRHRLQPRRHAADGNRQRGRHRSPEEAFAYLSALKQILDLRRRQRCRHGKGPDALRRATSPSAPRARRNSAPRAR